MQISEIKKMLSYDAETGKFSWRVSPCGPVAAGKETGYVGKDGYVSIGFGRKVYKAHRLAWAIHYGEVPPKYLDHINGNRSDNRIVNLRPATRAQNAQNLHRPYKNNKSSGILGVYWHSQCNRWQSRIQLNGKPKHLGLFDTKEEAAAAYAKAKAEYHPYASAYHPSN